MHNSVKLLDAGCKLIEGIDDSFVRKRFILLYQSCRSDNIGMQNYRKFAIEVLRQA